MACLKKLLTALYGAFFTRAVSAPSSPIGNTTMFEALKAVAQSEIDALKTDSRSAEERIESAFKLGAMHAAIDSAKQKLLAELAAAEAKIRAEFGA